MSSNKVIAKNTLFLYFRMMFTMVVSLFTSRVILEKLGVDDYGVYQAVGGVVGFLSFINGALSTGSSRFLTFALGEGSFEKLKKTFSTTFSVHFCLALVVVVVAETIGIWFLHNKMIVAPERLSAAVLVFHLSVVTAFFSIIQVPFNASIIAHEEMSIYAYVSIIEVLLKLSICYALGIGGFDRLVVYAVLLCGVQVCLSLFYCIYCMGRFSETRYCPKMSDKVIFKEIASFSGWSLFSNGSIALNSQGILILLNIFFSPSVVTARAISLQVNLAANQFVNNFRLAVNPQIVKRYAAKDYEGSKNLLLNTTKFSYYLMFAISLPIILLAEPFLNVWLRIVPEYTVVFLQLIVVQSLFQVFDTSFYTALYAKGQLKENALLSPTLGLLRFPIIYLLFKLGCSPVALSWASIVTFAMLGMVVKPCLIIRIVDYTWHDILGVLIPCFKVSVASIVIPFVLLRYANIFSAMGFVLVATASLLSTAFSVYLFGLDKMTRNKLVLFIREKIGRV